MRAEGAEKSDSSKASPWFKVFGFARHFANETRSLNYAALPPPRRVCVRLILIHSLLRFNSVALSNLRFSSSTPSFAHNRQTAVLRLTNTEASFAFVFVFSRFALFDCLIHGKRKTRGYAAGRKKQGDKFPELEVVCPHPVRSFSCLADIAKTFD